MDKEEIYKALECCSKECYRNCPYFEVDSCHSLLAQYVLTILEEQEKEIKSWTKQIADYQLEISFTDPLTEYEKGKWDGLQIAWNIISEGR